MFCLRSQSALKLALCALLAAAFSSCGGAEKTASGEHSPEVRYWFVDATEESGLAGFEQVNGTGWKDHIIEVTGGGVALFDYDLDGDLDVYFTNAGEFSLDEETGKEVRDALYANDGKGHFTDVTRAANLGDKNWTNGVSVVDYDGDGWPDIYLTNFGPNALLRNQGDGTFRNVTREAGVRGQRWSMGSCFVDYDRDGDLDLYVSNYIVLKKANMLANLNLNEYSGVQVPRGPRGMPPQHDLFYINEGQGVFREASEEVGIVGKPGFGFQIAILDYDSDGWMDLYVANDSVPNYLWRNDREGGFEDRGQVSGVSVSNMGTEQAGMGVAVGDYDGDLRDDLFVTNFALDYSTLYNAKSDRYFYDVTQISKLVRPTFLDVSWGCGFNDFDNDGDNEIYAVNGHVYSNIGESQSSEETYPQLNYIFEYNGSQWHSPPGAGGPGFAVNKVSRGSAVGDIDGDGDLDIIICNLDDAPTLLRNESVNQNHWVLIDLVGEGQNLDAIGARVVLTAGRKIQARTQAQSHGFLSSSDMRMHFGLGKETRVDSVEVIWPDGKVEFFKGLAADQVHKLQKGQSK